MDTTRDLIVGGGLTSAGACKGIRDRDPDGHILKWGYSCRLVDLVGRLR
jgi:hypothetical protein